MLPVVSQSNNEFDHVEVFLEKSPAVDEAPVSAVVRFALLGLLLVAIEWR
jgi:hypothetical protein